MPSAMRHNQFSPKEDRLKNCRHQCISGGVSGAGAGLMVFVGWKSEEQELLDHLQSFPLSTEKLPFPGNRHHIEKGHMDRNQESAA